MMGQGTATATKPAASRKTPRANKASREKRPKGQKTCPMCPKPLTGKQSYCSDACKAAAYRERKRKKETA